MMSNSGSPMLLICRHHMSETNHERTLYVRYVFRNQLISGKRVRRRYRPQEKLRLSNPEKIGVRETQLSLFLRSSESRRAGKQRGSMCGIKEPFQRRFGPP